jgi:ABC-2 type transport system permease protein
MISTLLRVFWINLRRDRVVWLLTFVVPVAFFSIFALIFGSQDRGGTPTIHVAVVDEDGSDFTKSLVAAMEKERSLRVTTTVEGQGTAGQTPRLTRQDAEALVRSGKVAAAVILPKKLGQSFPSFGGDRPSVELLADSSDPVAPQMLGGMLQGLVMTAVPDSMLKGGIEQMKKWGGPLTPQQEKAFERADQILKRPAKEDGKGGPASGLLDVKVVDLIGQEKANPVIAFYAAATAVMFLLFACANGAGGSLIEEVENGTLDRLLSSNMTMTQLLIGKWISFILLGLLQVTVMFVWGWLVFSVELWSHLAGFFVMTIITSAAAAAFGIMLGTFCHTRGQLAGISTTVILLMSAVGGSMFPRFAMSETLQKVGLFTFNAWALDGYQKVFWRDAPVWELWPQVLVLVCLTLIFFAAARWLGARRWEAV